MNCCGLLGKIFGHKYEAVYDVNEEAWSEKELEALYRVINRELIIKGFTTPAKTFYAKRITKVYLGHVCKRCGDKKEIEEYKID